MSQYQKGRTNLDFTEATDSERQWHQLGQMQVCPSLQTDNHTITPPLMFLQAGCASCRPTNSVKALKGLFVDNKLKLICLLTFQQLVTVSARQTQVILLICILEYKSLRRMGRMTRSTILLVTSPYVHRFLKQIVTSKLNDKFVMKQLTTT